MTEDNQILAALERLAASFPWDEVSIWLTRKPDGRVRFTTHLPSDYSTERESVFGSGETLAEACADLLKSAGPRDPDDLRKRKLEELRQKIAKLEAAQFGLPPYKPGLLLAPGALNPDIDLDKPPF